MTGMGRNARDLPTKGELTVEARLLKASLFVWCLVAALATGLLAVDAFTVRDWLQFASWAATSVGALVRAFLATRRSL